MNDTQYHAVTQGAGLLDFSDRTKIELTGADRATFLHNLCTNEIRQLAPGTGCEVFLTDVQAKIVAYGLVFCSSDSLTLDTVPGQAEAILQHLDRYLIREDVQIIDRTDAWGELFLTGAEAPNVLQSVTQQEPPGNPLSHANVQIADQAVVVRRAELAHGHGFLIQCQRQSTAPLAESLVAAGATRCDWEAFEVARIEAGTPLFGRDISGANLPQEVNRNEQAISFTKGCYLGQETVARIDALGHVNQTLCSVRFHGDAVPESGTQLMLDGKKVGHVTSATFSPKLGTPLALAYVRRRQSAIGTRLSWLSGEAEVIGLPPVL